MHEKKIVGHLACFPNTRSNRPFWNEFYACVAIATDYMLLKIAEFKSRTLKNMCNPISASESLNIQDCWTVYTPGFLKKLFLKKFLARKAWTINNYRWQIILTSWPLSTPGLNRFPKDIQGKGGSSSSTGHVRQHEPVSWLSYLFFNRFGSCVKLAMHKHQDSGVLFDYCLPIIVSKSR